MNKLFSTIRSKMLLSYGVYIIILIIVIITSFWFEQRREQVEFLSRTLQVAKEDLQIANGLLASFLSDETINTNFYQTKESKYLSQWREKTKDALSSLEKLDSLNTELGLETPIPIEAVKINIDQYEKSFEELIDMVLYRGFQDYGLEGKMRNYIHVIEGISITDQALMLMCRRHEKDFFLRKQTQYIGKLKDATEALKIDFIQKTNQGEDQDSIVNIINSYQETFVEIVKAEELIGFDYQSGIRGKIKDASDQLSLQIQQYSNFTEEAISNIKFTGQNIQVVIIGSGLLLSLFLAFFMPQILSRPIRDLSSSIRSVVGNNFKSGTKVIRIESKDEIGRLSNDFSFMLDNMQNLIEELKANNERVEREQKLLMDSIRYARQIQGAILPNNELIGNFFPSHFLIFRPLHIVSGDFFWMIRKNGRVYVAVADCTGHGVPGAFMSMIGHTLLNKIINQDHIYEPAAVLEVLHLEIREALHQDKTDNTGDGMDIGLFAMEYFDNKPNERLITFSGAKTHLMYSENGDFNVIKGTRRSIGGGVKKQQEEKAFETHVITLHTGDHIYMATDGFADQNNIKREKFGKKKLQKTIAKICMLSFEIQQQDLENALDNHQEGTQQRDDITLLALEL